MRRALGSSQLTTTQWAHTSKAEPGIIFLSHTWYTTQRTQYAGETLEKLLSILEGPTHPQSPHRLDLLETDTLKAPQHFAVRLSVVRHHSSLAVRLRVDYARRSLQVVDDDQDLVDRVRLARVERLRRRFSAAGLELIELLLESLDLEGLTTPGLRY